MSVAEAVKGASAEGEAAVLAENGDVVADEVVPVIASAYVVAGVVELAEVETAFGLMGAGGTDFVGEFRADGDDAYGGGGLWGVLPYAGRMMVGVEGGVDGDGHGVRVDVAPLEGEAFASAHAGVVGEHDGEAEAVSAGVVLKDGVQIVLCEYVGGRGRTGTAGDADACRRVVGQGGADGDGVAEGGFQQGELHAERGMRHGVGLVIEEVLELQGTEVANGGVTEDGEHAVLHGVAVGAKGGGLQSALAAGAVVFVPELAQGDVLGLVEVAFAVRHFFHGFQCIFAGFGFRGAAGAFDVFLFAGTLVYDSGRVVPAISFFTIVHDICPFLSKTNFI